MNTLVKIWRSKYLIWEGLMNKIFKKDPIEIMARQRLYICKGCSLIDEKGIKCLVPGTHPCCGDCGCSLALKLRSPASECTHPDGPKWGPQEIANQNSNQDGSNI